MILGIEKKMTFGSLRDLNFAKDGGRRKHSSWIYLKQYLWMLWDGSNFFGYDDTKLARLKGEKTSYFDKFKNKRWLGTTIIMIFICIVVLMRETSKIGTVKS